MAEARAGTRSRASELTARYLCAFSAKDLPQRKVDVLVVGSGIAGLTAALLAPKDKSVMVVTKSSLSDTGTGYAQGGIATAVGEEDRAGLHFEDTLKAGDGLCDRAAVAVLVTEARAAVDWLIELGADFDRLGGSVELAMEGGHSVARIIHAGDTTGAEIQRTLCAAAQNDERLELVEHRFLVDLLTWDGRCVGAVLARMDEEAELEVVWSGAVVLATGGAGRLFADTTNPDIATGDGLVVAYRAGAQLRDLEFVQFHPTALDTKENPRFLISEALRGKGALLVDGEGNRFMEGRHPRAELAPRDVVVRAMVDVMRADGCEHVWLDATGIGAKALKKSFPVISARCKEGGFDLAKDRIPVRPAAHYMIGGIRTDIDGCTSLPGLFAAGECASTGVHGANRLASNSLLEGLVFSRRIVHKLGAPPPPMAFDITYEVGEAKKALDSEAIARAMSGCVGVARTGSSMAKALAGFRALGSSTVTCRGEVGGMESFNLLTLAELVTGSALLRRESRGAHFRQDFPERDDVNWTRRIVHQRGRDSLTEAL